MAKLYFKIGSDVEKVIQLRNEISRLKQELVSLGSNRTPQVVAALETRLVSAKQEMNGLVTEAAKAAVAFEKDLKKGIYEASQSINNFTEKIISQKNVIGTLQTNIRKNKELYRDIVSKGNDDKLLFNRIREQEKTLGKERDSLFKLTQQQTEARLSVKKLRDEYSLYKQEGQSVVNVNEGMSASFKKTLAAIGGTAMIKKFITDVVRVRGTFQQLDVSLKTLLQDEEEAHNLMNQMVRTAAETPFSLTDVATGGKQLIAYGMEAEQVNDTLIRLGNIASGLNLPLERLTYLYGTTMTQGRLYARDLLQFTTSGIPMLQGLADMYGKSTEEINKMVSAGKIGFPEVKKVIENLTNEGGKFYNLMQEQSKTVTGKISNLGDAWDVMLNKIGESQEGIINGSLDVTKFLIENYEGVGKIILGLIEVYGVYRAALIFNAVVEQGFTKAIWAKVIATKAATLAQVSYNKVLAMNPWVLVGATLLSFSIAMWKLADHTSAAEKAMNSYNKKVKELEEGERKRKHHLEELVSELQNECTAEIRRQEIIDEIKRDYPSFFKFLLNEKGIVEDLTNAWKAYNETVAQERVKENKSNASRLNQNNQEYKKIIALWEKFGNDPNFHKDKLSDEEKLLAFKYKNETLENLKQKIEANEKELWQWEKNVRDDNFNQWKVDLKKKTDEQIEAIRTALVRKAKTASGDKNLLSALGKRIVALDEEKKTRNPQAEIKNEAYWKKQKETADTALKAIDSIQKKLMDAGNFNGIDSKVVESYKKNSKLLKEAEQELKVYDFSSKQENQANKLRKEQDKYKLLLDKQTLDKKRSAEDLQTQVDEARIKAMQDSSKKTIAQMELDNKKEIQQLERQKEDYIRNAIQAEREKFEANPSNKGKSFNPSTVSVDASSFDSIITNTKVRQKNDEIKEHQQAWENYLIEYGNFLQKKEALTVQYNAKINEASTQGEKESLKKELGTKLKELKFNELKDSLNFADVFGDLDSQTTTALTSLRDKLKEYINKAAKDLKPEDLKELQDAFTNIDFKITERNPFEELKNGLKEYKNSCQEIEKAQKVLNATQQFGFATIEEYDKVTGKVTYSLITQKQAEKDLANAQSDRQKSLSKLTQSANSIGSKGMEVVNAGNELVDMLSNFGVEMPEAVGETLDGIGQIMSGLERIDLTKPFSAVTGSIGILSGVGNTIAGLLGFGNKANELTEKQIQEYESLSDAMDKCIDRHKALMDELTNEEAVTEYEKTIELTKRKIEATKKIGEDYMNSNAKRSHTYGYKMRKDIEPYRAELASIGIDLDSLGGRLENIFSLPVDKLKQLQETSAWTTLDKQTQEYIQTLIDADEKVKELGDDLNENLTQTSFDSVLDNFLNMLTDMDSSTEDFAENFEEYMRNAILRSMLVKNYQDRIKEWYSKFSQANKDGIDNKEYEELKQDWNIIVTDAKRDTDALKNDFGWGSSSSSQSSTSKGFAAMSQDTGEELNGRFTALQIAGEEIKAQSILQTGLLSSIHEKMSDIHLPDARNSVSIVNEIPSLEGLREIFISSMAQRDNSSGQLLEQVVLLKGEVSRLGGIVDEMRTTQAIGWGNVGEMTENVGKITKANPEIVSSLRDVKNNTNGLSRR